MKTPWLDVRTLFPGLRGQFVHVTDGPVETLVERLVPLGFQVYWLDGSQIIDEATFFAEAASTFGFPDYFGHNWSAWHDCLGDFVHRLGARAAIVWEYADHSIEADVQTFLNAVFDLWQMAQAVGLHPSRHPGGADPRQVVVFLIGETVGFGAGQGVR